MAVIDASNPLETEEREIKRREGVRALALDMLNDSGLLREAMTEEAGYHDAFMKSLKRCVKSHMKGRHPDCFELGRDLTFLTEKYIREVAEEEYME